MSLTSRNQTVQDFYCLSAGDGYYSFDSSNLFWIFLDKKTPAESTKSVNVLEEKLSYSIATEIKKTEDSRLVLGFSLKSPDFTSKANVEAFSKWGLNHFNETSVWLSGPLQRWTVLFEEIFMRVINDFSHNHQVRLPDTKPTDKENKKAVEKGEELEKNAVGRLLQVILNDQPADTMTIRDAMTSIGTPLINKRQATTESKQLTPIKARQKTPKVNDILGAEGEAYRKKFKVGKKRVFQLISWKYLTQGQGPEVQQSAELFRQYMNDKNLSSAFEILKDDFGRSRLRYAYGKINDDVIVKIYNNYQLVLKEKDNILPLHVINNPAKPENKKLILDYLVDNDVLGLLSLSKKYTGNVFLEEFPVFMAECERARMLFQEENTITHFAYPLSKSEKVFVFIAQLFKKRYGEKYLKYFKWVDTSSLIMPRKTHAGDAKELVPDQKSLRENAICPPPLPIGPAKTTATEVFFSQPIRPLKRTSDGAIINTEKLELHYAKPLSLQKLKQGQG